MLVDAIPQRVDAVFFDLDGTLVNTRLDFIEALNQVITQYQDPLSPHDYQYIVGHYWEDIYQFLQTRAPLPLALPTLQEKTYEQRLQHIQARGPSTLPGTTEVIPRLSQKIPCALVTGSRRKDVEILIDAMGIRSSFHFLICAEDTLLGKPAPDPYLVAAQRLQIDPQFCIVVEDSTVGITAARSAGMYCIAVQAGNFSSQNQSAAQKIVETLYDVEKFVKDYIPSPSIPE